MRDRICNILALLFLASFCSPIASAQMPPLSQVSSNIESVLDDLAGNIWIQKDIQPVLYLQYEQEQIDGTLLFAGMDNDGNIIGGYFATDPQTFATTAVSVRNGQVSEFVVTSSPGKIVLTGSEAGIEVRQTLERASATRYNVVWEEMRNGRWVHVRDLSSILAKPEMVRALGWVESNPEAEKEAEATRKALMAEQPGFFDRLKLAVQDGVVTGLRDGLETGISERVTNELVGSPSNVAELEGE